MRDRAFRSSRSRRNIFLLAIAVVLIGLPARAQKSQPNTPGPPNPKYDLHTEAKIKGTIEEVKLPSKGSEKEIAHLQVKDGTNSVDVYLCPKSFFDDMGMSFAKGDEIAITGSKVKVGEIDVILAREIVKGSNDTFVLRDGKGDPVWSWKH
jgi:hypothetical protein